MFMVRQRALWRCLLMVRQPQRWAKQGLRPMPCKVYMAVVIWHTMIRKLLAIIPLWPLIIALRVLRMCLVAVMLLQYHIPMWLSMVVISIVFSLAVMVRVALLPILATRIVMMLLAVATTVPELLMQQSLVVPLTRYMVAAIVKVRCEKVVRWALLNLPQRAVIVIWLSVMSMVEVTKLLVQQSLFLLVVREPVMMKVLQTCLVVPMLLISQAISHWISQKAKLRMYLEETTPAVLLAEPSLWISIRKQMHAVGILVTYLVEVTSRLTQVHLLWTSSTVL